MPKPPPEAGVGTPTAASNPLADVVARWSEHPQRAVIFDFNGTLSDDEIILQEIFAQIFAQRLGWHLTPEDYHRRFAGYSDREIVEKVLEEQGFGEAGVVDELLARRGDLYRQRVADTSPIGSGAVGLVQRLAAEGVPLAIVTGAQREDVECVLANCEIGALIDTIVTEEDVARGKPHPEGFLRGAELLGVPADAVLVFEDSVPGVTAARAAGMSCVAVSSETGPSRLAELADATVPRLQSSLVDVAPALPS